MTVSRPVFLVYTVCMQECITVANEAGRTYVQRCRKVWPKTKNAVAKADTGIASYEEDLKGRQTIMALMVKGDAGKAFQAIRSMAA